MAVTETKYAARAGVEETITSVPGGFITQTEGLNLQEIENAANAKDLAKLLASSVHGAYTDALTVYRVRADSGEFGEVTITPDALSEGLPADLTDALLANRQKIK